MKFSKILILFFALFTANISFGQYTESALDGRTTTDIENNNRDAQTLLRYAGIKGEGSLEDSGRMTNGSVTVDRVIRRYDSAEGEADLAIFVQRNERSGEVLTTTFLEIGENAYIVGSRGGVELLKSNWFTKLIDCFQDEGAAIFGSDDCDNCVNKVKACKGKKKWKRFKCIISAVFSADCIKCGVGVWKFVKCIWKAFK